jgi:hypothetical protein
LTEEPSVLEAIFHDGSESVETEMDQIVVLCNDLGSWSREAQGVRLFCPSQIMKFENEMPGQIGFVPPDDPS